MAIIDWEQFNENYQYYDEEIIREIIEDFLTESDERLVNLQKNIKDNDFEKAYVDGSNDGGLDFVSKPDDNAYYILQSKFTANPKKTNLNEIRQEITKIFKTITNENTNKKQ